MSWIPLVAWITTVVLALIVLGFCAYELIWKVRRLLADLGRLRALNETLHQLQTDVAATQERLDVTGAHAK